MDEDTLQCTACQMYLTPEEFHRDKHSPTGYKHQCKYCRQENHADRYDKLKARRAIQQAFRDGSLDLKPCQSCPSEHAEYVLPDPLPETFDTPQFLLSLKWLCPDCYALKKKRSNLTPIPDPLNIKARKKIYNKLYYQLKTGKLTPKFCNTPDCKTLTPNNNAFHINSLNETHWFCPKHHPSAFFKYLD